MYNTFAAKLAINDIIKYVAFFVLGVVKVETSSVVQSK